MPRPTKGEIFLNEFVMGMGFLGGLFTRIGIDPEKEIIKALAPQFLLIFGLFLVLVGILRFLIAYSLGGILGIFAIIIAFISGYIILSSTEAGALLLIFAAILGQIAPYQ